MRRFLLLALPLLPLAACGEGDTGPGGYTCGEGTHPEGGACVPDTGMPCDCDDTGGTCEDLDGDGWPRAGGDCDDADPTVNPGQPEVCNGQDDDCDGSVDNEAEDATWWYPDADGDGYGDPAGKAVLNCSSPGGHVADDTDCDDTDPGVSPGAEEVWYDGADGDCDGGDDYDQDGDGYRAEAWGGDDCGDESDQVGPHMSEICDDGMDNDCDGSNNGCGIEGSLSVTEATATLTGTANGDYGGSAVASAGDVDGDGRGDILVGIPRADTGGSNAGDAALLLGPVSGTIALALADAVLSGGAAGDLAGTALSGLGDLDGDGHGEIAIGANGDDSAASGAGAVYLLPGPIASGSLAAAPTALLGAAENDGFGGALAPVGDTDLDGRADLLVGASGNDDGGSNAGAAFLFTAWPAGRGSASDAAAIIVGAGDGQNAGWAVGGGGDTDGDGLGDLLVGAPYADTSASDAGLVACFRGGFTGEVGIGGADALLLGTAAQDNAGYAVAGAGDANGDGYDDVLAGAPGSDAGGGGAGQACLFWGPLTGSRSFADAELNLVGDAASGRVGIAVAGGGDINRDGLGDVLVGGDRYASGQGAAFLVLGSSFGTVAASGADAVIVGEVYYDWAGASVALAGDTNGDGRTDLLLGAWGSDAAASDAGAAYLFEGHGI